MSQPSKMFKLAPVCVLVLALASATLADVDEVITSAPAETTSTTTTTTEAPSSTAAAPGPAAPPAPAPSPAVGLSARALFDNLGKDFGQQQPLEVQCKIDDIVIKAGQKHAYKDECTQLTCHHDGMITGITCPFVIAPPGCQINPQDLSKPYPQCCETWTC